MNNVFFHSQNRKTGSTPPPTQTVTIPRYYFGIDSVSNYVGILAYNYNNCHYELIWNDSYGDNGHWHILDVTKSQKVIRSTPSLTLFDFWGGERLSNKKGNSFRCPVILFMSSGHSGPMAQHVFVGTPLNSVNPASTIMEQISPASLALL